MENTNPERRRFKGLMETLAVSFRAELTTPMLEAYWLALEEFDFDAVQHAAKRMIREQEYLPAPARLREAARQYTKDRDFWNPTTLKQKALKAEAEEERAAESWKGHEDELKAMREHMKRWGRGP